MFFVECRLAELKKRACPFVDFSYVFQYFVFYMERKNVRCFLVVFGRTRRVFCGLARAANDVARYGSSLSCIACWRN
jgi:hypothetical protein